MIEKKFKKNNVLYVKNEKTYLACVSKQNSKHKKVILSMIPNEEGWHYIAVIKLSALLIGITSKVIFITRINFIALEQKKT